MTERTQREVKALLSGYKIFVIGPWRFVIGHLEKSDPLGGAEAEGFGVGVRGEVTHTGAARHPWICEKILLGEGTGPPQRS